MVVKQNTLNVIEMERGEDGSFDQITKISDFQEKKITEETVTHPDQGPGFAKVDSQTPNADVGQMGAASFWEQGFDRFGNASVAEKIRAANEKYILDTRREFDQSRREILEKMSCMTNIYNT